MDQLFEQALTIAPGICDAEGRLSYHDAFRVCMDIAAAHAQILGCGPDAMTAKGRFWLTVKTQISFVSRPRMMEKVVLRTWPEQPGKLRGNRSYQMLRGDEILLSGKTEWAVMDIHAWKPMLLNDVYPPELQFSLDSALPGPFARIADAFDESETVTRYLVRSTDIDLGGHMNNAAYLRALFGCFSSEELKNMTIRDVDVIFRSPCFEGEELTLQRKQAESGYDLRFAKPDGSTALLVRIV